MPPSEALHAAIEELQAGRGAEAEQIVRDAAAEAEQRYGHTSFEHAAALFDLGRFFTFLGDYRRAAEVIRRAADLELPGEQGVQDRLTYLRNVGEMLRYGGDLEGAETVLREGLDRRREHYGPTHAGYAFGLEALAEVVWLRGAIDDALAMVREAVTILWSEGNSQVFSTLGLRAFLHHALQANGSAFADLPALDDEPIDAIIANALFRVDHVNDKKLCVSVLDDLQRWVASRRASEDETLAGTVAKLADCQRLIGDHAGRQATLRRLINVFKANDQADQAIKAAQALAVALDEAGDPGAAEQVYHEALAEARAFGDPARLSSVLRNFGLHLKDHQRAGDAEPLLREAVEVARQAHDADACGRALVALGILIQHEGRLDEARPMLEQSLQLLPPAHTDTLYARSHLDAIIANRSCGCGDMSTAFSDALRAIILPSLPPDLLEDLVMHPGGNLEVRLARSPTPDEQELLQRVVDHAMRELKRRYDEAGYS